MPAPPRRDRGRFGGMAARLIAGEINDDAASERYDFLNHC
jgi:hypothetical protein